MKKAFVFGLVLALVAVGPALAEKTETGTGLLMSATATGDAVAIPDGPRSDPDSFLNFALDGVEHWDLLGEPENTVLSELLGEGASLTGIGWNATLETVGGSWLSEARTYFDGSDLDGSGLFLTIGTGDGMPGIGTYSSGGILDLTDNGIPDIPVLADGLLHIDFHETFDDNADAVDSFYPVAEGAGSSYDLAGIGFVSNVPIIEIPTASTLGLIALFIGLAALGVYLLRR